MISLGHSEKDKAALPLKSKYNGWKEYPTVTATFLICILTLNKALLEALSFSLASDAYLITRSYRQSASIHFFKSW